MIRRLFTDGGLVKSDPSPIGGTWCWLGVDVRDNLVKGSRGFLAAQHLENYGFPRLVNSNQAELYAIMHGLESMADGWYGEVWTDSLTAIQVATRGHGRVGPLIPEEWLERCQKTLARLGPVAFRLVKSHPSEDDLACGYKHKAPRPDVILPHCPMMARWCHGAPVSVWNMRADAQCRDLSRRVASADGQSIKGVIPINPSVRIW